MTMGEDKRESDSAYRTVPKGKDDVLVLHVDDDPRMGKLLTRRLESLSDDTTVISITDPREALDRLSTDPIDCLVSDYQMPDMDGLELLHAVRENYPNFPFILFTGAGNENIASKAIDAGVTSYLPKWNSDSFDRLLNAVQNAVSRHRSERRAEIANDRLIALYEQAGGFYTIDEDWTITYWNHCIADRTGYAPEDVTGRRFWEVFPDASDSDVYSQFQSVIEHREPVAFETDYEPHDSWVKLQAYPVEEGLFVHSREITEDKRRRQEIERRNQILESFAHTVSHDLRNPLSLAQGELRQARDTGDMAHLDEVARAHNQMRNLIDELLRIARGEEVPLSELSLAACSRDAYKTVGSEEMSLVAEGDASFEGHGSQLRRLFENLFWNALEHGEADTVRVGVLEDGFFVEDDGSGIPPEDRERVFDSGYTTADEGTGYGLHIVQNIVKLHEWDITVTAGGDSGARFEITGVRFVDR